MMIRITAGHITALNNGRPIPPHRGMRPSVGPRILRTPDRLSAGLSGVVYAQLIVNQLMARSKGGIPVAPPPPHIS